MVEFIGCLGLWPARSMSRWKHLIIILHTLHKEHTEIHVIYIIHIMYYIYINTCQLHVYISILLYFQRASVDASHSPPSLEYLRPWREGTSPRSPRPSLSNMEIGRSPDKHSVSDSCNSYAIHLGEMEAKKSCQMQNHHLKLTSSKMSNKLLSIQDLDLHICR